MKTKFFPILCLCATIAMFGCTANNNAKRTIPAVEYTKPVHVSRSVSQKRVYAGSRTDKTQVGVIKPYQSANTKKPVPYVSDNVADTTSQIQTLTPDTYKVKAGDTLYSVAFRYGKDYRVLAKNNGIESPYNITVGQVLSLNTATQSGITKENKKPKSYVVKPGDTAVSVAHGNGLTLSQLVKANNLKSPYHLTVGQRLSLVDSKGQHFEDLRAPSSVPVAGSSETKTAKNSTTAAAVPAAVNISTPVQVVSGKTSTVSGMSWMWPTKGRVIKNFSSSNNGLDIAGSRGQNVNAAAAGQVVYSGNALRGYGNLIIINHNNQYLSAYAHNDMLLVKEGQKVKRGQVIAKMGSTDASQVMLHFEIRYKGNSVDPRKYLPK